MTSPVDAAMPVLRAAAAPRFSVRISLTSEKRAAASPEPSVEPSSTTTSSEAGRLWARTLSIASAMNRSPLNTGITTLIDLPGTEPAYPPRDEPLRAAAHQHRHPRLQRRGVHGAGDRERAGPDLAAHRGRGSGRRLERPERRDRRVISRQARETGERGRGGRSQPRRGRGGGRPPVLPRPGRHDPAGETRAPAGGAAG